MLGVQRSTVTAATSLQARGLISHSRGRITVCDRAALEQAPCDCHAVVMGQFERVLPGVYSVFGQVEP